MNDAILETKSLTKIHLRRVLVVTAVLFLAVAAFAGGGTAAGTDYGTVFVYQLSPDIQGSWTLGASTITATQDYSSGMYYFAGYNIVEGTYKRGDDKITIKYPTAIFNGLVLPAVGTPYLISNGDSFYQYGMSIANITATSAAVTSSMPGYYPPMTPGMVSSILVTYPNGTQALVAGNIFACDSSMPRGQYKLQAVFDRSAFVLGAPDNIFVSKNAFTVIVAGIDGLTTLRTATDSVIEGETFKLDITGVPGGYYYLHCEGLTIASTGTVSVMPTPTPYPGSNSSSGSTGEPNMLDFIMPNTGKATIYLRAVESGEAEIYLENIMGTSVDSVIYTINVLKDAGTITTDKDVYYLGETIKLSGTVMSNSLDGILYIRGPNYPETVINPYFKPTIDGNTWKAEISLRGLGLSIPTNSNDPDRYVLTISRPYGDNLTALVKVRAPEFYLESSPSKIVAGNSYNVYGVAEAERYVDCYIFGEDGLFLTSGRANEDGSFTIPIIATNRLAPGEYTLIVQNYISYGNGTDIFIGITDPYYPESSDDVSVIKNYSVYKRVPYDPTAPYYGPTPLFNSSDFTPAVAMQKLCDAMDAENVDDIYIKTTFRVLSPSEVTITLDETPASLPQGGILTVSGQTNLGAGESIAIELLATKFSHMSPEFADAGYFTYVTALTEADGSFVAELDTSGLEVDSYNLTAYVQSSNISQSMLTTRAIAISEGVPSPVAPGQDTVLPTALLLNAGWNFISVPSYLDESCDTAGELISGIDTNGFSMLGYNVNESVAGWSVISKNDKITPLNGYWIYVKDPVLLRLTYSNKINTPPAKQLLKGWNAIGISADEPMSARSAFASTTWLRYIPWNSSENKWDKPIVNGGSSANSAENLLTLGNGGWLYVETAGVYLGNTA